VGGGGGGGGGGGPSRKPTGCLPWLDPPLMDPGAEIISSLRDVLATPER